MHDLFISDEFVEYQKKLIETMSKELLALIGSKDYSKVQGAMQMARNVVNLPYKTVKSDDVKIKTQEAWNKFEFTFMKRGLENDE